MMPPLLLLLFHLTIVILFATSLNLILSIPKLVKIYRRNVHSQLNKKIEQDREPTQGLDPIKKQWLIQQIEEVQINMKQFNKRIQRINDLIEQTSNENQKILQQYFRPYQWSKSNKK